jgi:sulfite exporter TauE/SafE
MTDYLELLLFAALTAGLMGGVHCGAMCGGIVGAVCNLQAGGLSSLKRWRYALAYNGGRILSYTIAGALAGTLGQGVLWLRGGPAVQQALMFGAGIMLFVIALYVSGFTPVTRGIEAAGGRLWRHVQPYSRWFLPVDSMFRALGLGAVWGWLPCGMVYAVLLTAVATADSRMGALVMLAFGLGTLPNLLAITFFFGRIGKLAARGPVRIVTALLIAGVGIFGIIKATQPALASDGWLCQAIPGLMSLRP